MKTLSIKQPWASLIAYGIKDIENRTWKTNFRGRIYIHASGCWVQRPSEMNTFALLYNDAQWMEIIKKHENFSSFLVANPQVDPKLPLSAIIGEVDIVDCVINHPSIWAEKTLSMLNVNNTTLGIPQRFGSKGKDIIYNWVLSNAVIYDEPILNVKGKLSLWEYETVL